jgi:hypothetical protein
LEIIPNLPVGVLTSANGSGEFKSLFGEDLGARKATCENFFTFDRSLDPAQRTIFFDPAAVPFVKTKLLKKLTNGI